MPNDKIKVLENLIQRVNPITDKQLELIRMLDPQRPEQELVSLDVLDARDLITKLKQK